MMWKGIEKEGKKTEKNGIETYVVLLIEHESNGNDPR